MNREMDDRNEQGIEVDVNMIIRKLLRRMRKLNHNSISRSILRLIVGLISNYKILCFLSFRIRDRSN